MNAYLCDLKPLAERVLLDPGITQNFLQNVLWFGKVNEIVSNFRKCKVGGHYCRENVDDAEKSRRGAERVGAAPSSTSLAMLPNTTLPNSTDANKEFSK